MSEYAFKQLFPSLLRQTRPQRFRQGKPPRYPQRNHTTVAATSHQGTQEPLTWTPHPTERVTSPSSSRVKNLRNDPEPREFSSFLTDKFSREHNYLRISVTERCNLRCVYCMPEEGVPLSPNSKLLSTPEIVYLSSLFVDQGVNKIRLTGGEPTVRRDIVDLMNQIGKLRAKGLKELCLTTNGISLHRKLDAMAESGLTGVNLSLDTLDPYQFTIMTRRNGHDAVMKSINRILEMNKLGAGIKLKINCVVMRGLNEREILPFVELGREKELEVRFIEYMPFDGNKWSERKMLSFKEMLAIIREKYPDVHKVQDHANDTSKTYKIPGFVGRIGFITSMTHNFCGTCNRLRITGDGNLKVCLFGNSEVSLRDILRESNNGQPIDHEAMEAIRQVESDRRKAITSSTGTLGTSEREARLLDVIGLAVKRKKEKHAGMENVSPMRYRRSTSTPPNHLGATTPTFSSSGHIPFHLLATSSSQPSFLQSRHFTTSLPLASSSTSPSPPPQLSHLTSTGNAHMVSIARKQPTHRTATATSTIHFSNLQTHTALSTASLQKGDAFAVARIAGITAAKKTADLIPLAHPGLGITGVSVDIDLISEGTGGVKITASVSCFAPTGVEMEALTAASVAGLTIYDMCKGVDKGMVMEGVRVVAKKGGKSGDWVWDGGVQEIEAGDWRRKRDEAGRLKEGGGEWNWDWD